MEAFFSNVKYLRLLQQLLSKLGLQKFSKCSHVNGLNGRKSKVVEKQRIYVSRSSS